jgi:hypothetical protein
VIIFIDEDRAYLHWVTHHRQGYVLDGRRKPKLAHLLIHRATCKEIKYAASSRVRWTTGTKIKACSLDRSALTSWANDETGAPPNYCATCRPEEDFSPEKAGPVHLTKLAREVLDYVLDAAVIHMEHEYPPYQLTVGDIAACFAKTPGQVVPVLGRLTDNGLLCPAGEGRTSSFRSPRRIVFPTMRAMRTLDCFRDESDASLQIELSKLNPPQPLSNLRSS